MASQMTLVPMPIGPARVMLAITTFNGKYTSSLCDKKLDSNEKIDGSEMDEVILLRCLCTGMRGSSG